jgi:cytochrome oxidase Cu insertion factor (SCO1/SenC/PrrC family)
MSKISMSKTKIWLLGSTLWFSLVGAIIAIVLLPASTNKVVTLPNYDYPTSHVIVFFGFPTCNGACPMTLGYLAKLTQQWNSEQGEMPQVLFINIDKDSTQYASMEYAKAYNQHFIGHMPSDEEFAQYKSDFGLNIHKLKNDITHMARSYLLKKEQGEWTIKKAYNPTEYTLKQLKLDLQNVEP